MYDKSNKSQQDNRINWLFGWISKEYLIAKGVIKKCMTYQKKGKGNIAE